MSLVIPPGFGSAAFILTGSAGTQPFVTTMGIDLTAAGGDFVAAADAAFACYAATILPETSNNLTLDRVTLSVGSDGPGGSVDSTLAPQQGGGSQTYPPTALSLIARKTTNILGRQGRGRMFIPGVLGEANVDPDGSITNARRNALNLVLDSFLLALQTEDARPAIPAVLLHGPSVPVLPPTPISGLTCSDLVGWVRGRIR